MKSQSTLVPKSHYLSLSKNLAKSRLILLPKIGGIWFLYCDRKTGRVVGAAAKEDDNSDSYSVSGSEESYGEEEDTESEWSLSDSSNSYSVSGSESDEEDIPTVFDEGLIEYVNPETGFIVENNCVVGKTRPV